jgi:hypothetical protein
MIRKQIAIKIAEKVRVCLAGRYVAEFFDCHGAWIRPGWPRRCTRAVLSRCPADATTEERNEHEDGQRYEPNPVPLTICHGRNYDQRTLTRN